MTTTIPDAVLTQHVAVLGKTGSGKTITAKLAVEQVVAAGARVCVLDPIKSDWWGLTSSANGKKEGLPFRILGGPRGHVGLHEKAGKAIAQVVAAGALPLSIIDMADFKPGGLHNFFVDFAPVLLRQMRGVLYLVMEEAHLFAPKERSGFAEENMAVHWSKMLATAGRSKGIRLILLTQRTQSLHNALLGSCDSMIAHRMTAPADQEPVSKWLKANTDKEIATHVTGSLSSLKTGEGWLCSGEAKVFERVRFPMISTYDNTRTPTDSDGEHHVKTAAVDKDQLTAIIGDAVKEAESNDPKLLRQKIAELERQLKGRPAETRTVEVEKLVEVPVLKNGQLDRTEKIAEKVDGIASKLTGELAELRRLIQPAFTPRPAPRPQQPRPVVVQRPAAAPIRRPVADPSDRLPVGEQKVLTAAAQYPSGVGRDQLSVLIGYKRSSRDAYIQRLREKGFVELSGNLVAATEAGVAALGSDFEPLPTGPDLQAYWIARLPEGERKIFEVLIGAHPQAVERDQLDELTGYKRSSRDAYIQRLMSRRLVVNEGRGMVRASDELF
jgi:hypothetical protein